MNKKVFKSLAEIKPSKLPEGTQCELAEPVKKRCCPVDKNYKDNQNFTEIEFQKGQISYIDGKPVLVVKKLRPDGFEQKRPKYNAFLN